MAQLKIRVHPLFWAFGIYFALTGKVFSFLVFTFSAIIHELGHYFASSKLGYKLNKITLMPYGALLSGDIDGIKYKDECKIAISGPLTNLCIAFFFVATWWFVPDVYPYTELIVLANFSLAIINLLPCYPLDGGRFLYATLRLFASKKIAQFISRGISVLASISLLILFILSLKTVVNLTLLFFSLFMLVGAISKSKENDFVRIYSTINFDNVKEPKIVRRIILSGDTTIKSLYNIIDYNYYYEIIVKLENNQTRLIKGENLSKLLTENVIYNKIKDCV